MYWQLQLLEAFVGMGWIDKASLNAVLAERSRPALMVACPPLPSWVCSIGLRNECKGVHQLC